ncbi:ATPase [Flavobacterium sp. Sd200]|uniref:SRPBCC domain-containing protein n=1 Tax=Flavobacterium sp. Sd200 TaxID=2692211 RepID=UPI00136D9603|nr:SRPBCC domain-containing protein [Flavobacterium sp. Sd200]MXN92665.1 ATPase [Flavobacterium sp. Sd200]
MDALIAKAALQINKPIDKVFEAVINPNIMANYFISKGSGRMEQGQTLQWSFPEFEGSFPVRVGAVEPNQKIVFYWDHEGNEHEVTLIFKAYKQSTVIKITESSEPVTEGGLAWAIGNTEGWAGFLLCMKAWLEYGIHLRPGAYDWRFDANANI